MGKFLLKKTKPYSNSNSSSLKNDNKSRSEKKAYLLSFVEKLKGKEQQIRPKYRKFPHFIFINTFNIALVIIFGQIKCFEDSGFDFGFFKQIIQNKKNFT